MATISNTPRPGYVWDSADNVWYPIGVGAHGHTADSVGAIANTLIDAKGDLLTATADNTPARLAVGSNNQVLTADSSTATGIKWATPATPTSGMTLITRQTASNVSALAINSVFSSTYKTYVIVCEKFWAATAADDIGFNLRFGTTDKTDAYYGSSGALRSDSDTLGRTGTSNGAFFALTSDSASSASNFTIYMNQVGQGSGPYPAWNGTGFRQEQGNAAVFFGGLCYASEAYTGIRFKSSSSNITIEVSIYGLAAS
jgi:hypothetical protein